VAEIIVNNNFLSMLESSKAWLVMIKFLSRTRGKKRRKFYTDEVKRVLKQ
jgi:hypothetical protein